MSEQDPCTPLPKRSRKSSIDTLAPAIKTAVNGAIREGRATIDEIVAIINAMGGEASRSAVGRYVQAQNVQLGKYRQAQEIAKVWVEKIGSEPEGDVGRLLIQMLRTVSFNTISNMDEVDPQDLMFLSKAIKDISSADKTMVDREAAVRKLVAAQVVKAAEEVTKTVRQAGMSAETVDLIRSQILGIGSEAAPAKRAAA